MANECLVTKLKESVQNDNLQKLGCFTFYKTAIQSDFSNNLWILVETVDTDIMEARTSEFLSNQGASLGDKYTVTANWARYINVGLGTGIFDFPRKYISKLTTSFQISAVYAPTEFVQYFPNLKTFEFGLKGDIKWFKGLDKIESFVSKSYSTIYGDIKVFKDMTTLKKLDISNVSGDGYVTGNIQSLGELTNLEELKFSTGRIGIEGRIEDFVHGQRNARTPRTSCEGMSITIFGSNITFNGTKVYSTQAKTLSWTASTITLDGVTINA